jgi:hypothetical protein
LARIGVWIDRVDSNAVDHDDAAFLLVQGFSLALSLPAWAVAIVPGIMHANIRKTIIFNNIAIRPRLLWNSLQVFYPAI